MRRADHVTLRQTHDKLTEAEQRELWALFRLGCTRRDVARQTGFNRNTVNRYFGRWSAALAKGAAASAAAAPFAGVVECDESYFGGDPRKASYEPPKPGQKRGRGAAGKVKVFGMVERGPQQVDKAGAPVFDKAGRPVYAAPGRVAPVVVPNVKAATLIPIIEAQADREHTRALITDDFKSYRPLEGRNWNHYPVNHSAGDWQEADTGAHTNTIESFWRHCKRYLHRFNGGWRPRVARWLGECAARWMWREPRDLLRKVAHWMRPT